MTGCHTAPPRSPSGLRASSWWLYTTFLLGNCPQQEKGLFSDGSLLPRTGQCRGVNAGPLPQFGTTLKGHASSGALGGVGRGLCCDSIEGHSSQLTLTPLPPGVSPGPPTSTLPAHKSPSHSLFPRGSSCNDDQNILHGGDILPFRFLPSE